MTKDTWIFQEKEEADVRSVDQGSGAWEFHRSLKEYSPTPLHHLADVAQEIGVKEVLVKDEAHRFGLGSFKALGSSFCLHALRQKEIPGVFCTASDGNHGIGLAWSARQYGCQAKIFLPQYVSDMKRRRIQQMGGEIIDIHGDYDATVDAARQASEKHDWALIQDTSWEGYTEVPELIMQGYTTMLKEISEPYDMLFLQVGVGSFASSLAAYANRHHSGTKVVLVEPAASDGMYQSLLRGVPSLPAGSGETSMQGLNCGVPSLLAFEHLKRTYEAMTLISEEDASAAADELKASNVYAAPSGAAGFAGLLKLREDRHVFERLGLSSRSRVLCINTEGV
jgi:diaminopropionate ammonia-lyase